jgi:diguanylate cyclase (GGDEF)-like protein
MLSLAEQGSPNPELEAVRSAIVAPLTFDEDTLGALALESSRPNAFTQSDLQLLSSLAATATAAIHNAMLHAQVQKIAITDSLTGVYNRRGFTEVGRRMIESARRFERPLSAIMLDVDNFKSINDGYGHATGDVILQAVAERLAHGIREVDLLGRFGGDEFAILFPETDLFTAWNVAERMRQNVSQVAIPTEHGSLSVTISQGLARYSSRTPDLDSLIGEADRALYLAKQSGRNRVEMLPLEQR